MTFVAVHVQHGKLVAPDKGDTLAAVGDAQGVYAGVNVWN